MFEITSRNKDRSLQSGDPKPLDSFSRHDWVLVLPDVDGGPAQFLQFAVRAPIPSDVRIQFFGPPFPVILRRSAMIGAAMPEAAIDEDGDARAGERDVRPARKRLEVGSVAHAALVKFPPKRPLCTSIPIGHRAHLAANCFVEWCRPPALRPTRSFSSGRCP